MLASVDSFVLCGTTFVVLLIDNNTVLNDIIITELSRDRNTEVQNTKYNFKIHCLEYIVGILTYLTDVL